MADPLALLLLAEGQAPAWWTPPRIVIISEGEPDFLTVATHYRDRGLLVSIDGHQPIADVTTKLLTAVDQAVGAD